MRTGLQFVKSPAITGGGTPASPAGRWRTTGRSTCKEEGVAGFAAGIASAAIVNVNRRDPPAGDSAFITVSGSLQAGEPTSGCSDLRSRHRQRGLLDQRSIFSHQ